MIEGFVSLGLLWFVAAAMPGPNFFAVVHTAVEKGRAASIAAVLGVVVGTAAWALAGFFGLQALFAVFPSAATLIKLAGGAYLIWIGIGLWRNAGASRAGRQPKVPSIGRAFLFGLSTNLANPKTAAFAASLFAVALPSGTSIAVSLLAVALVCFISLVWYSVVAVIGSTSPFQRTYARLRSVIMRATGVIFAGYGTRLMLQQ
ncbi:LysE family translocator [Denitrobaculum tricleocarpae]|uniref:Lysine transporter LysE n=1 Tax=Denitrobaculum tricleocarpae TaxID=2591009 RepID=A0A545TB72_9PROT|nr:LysE family transporter [Denitrobaculum tricleocarpae]TQV74468.1 lysine transporter LysE [Denitrobaculum tricleocarpae]